MLGDISSPNISHRDRIVEAFHLFFPFFIILHMLTTERILVLLALQTAFSFLLLLLLLLLLLWIAVKFKVVS
jgi:hypothetical protein